MKLDYDILVKALYEMTNGLSVTPRITAQEITNRSTVHNIQRIIDGSISPLAESWHKIHEAFPDLVPEPSYENGRKVYGQKVTGDKNVTASHHGKIGIVKHGTDLSPAEQTLIDALRLLPEDEKNREIFRLLGKLADH